MFILSPPPVNVSPSHHPLHEQEGTLLPDDGLTKLSSDTLLAMALSSPSSQPDGIDKTTTPALKRKRVRFEDADVVVEHDSSSSSADDCWCTTPSSTTTTAANRPVKRRVLELLPLCNELSDQEKNSRWIQRDEHDSIRAEMSEQAARSRRQDAAAVRAGQPELSFTQIYAQLIGICHAVDNDDECKPDDSSGKDSTMASDAICTTTTTTTTTLQQQQVLPDLLASMAVGRFAENRGLEDRTVPLLALERRFARAKAIRTVVECQHSLPNQDTVAELARVLSEPSRKLGETMAVVDATAALMEYARDVTAGVAAAVAATMETSRS